MGPINSGWKAGSYTLVVPWELEHPGGVNQVVMNLSAAFDAMYPGLPLVLVKSWAHYRPWDGMVEGRRTRRWRFRDPFPVRNRFRSTVLGRSAAGDRAASAVGHVTADARGERALSWCLAAAICRYA